jgi:hypothetical protein
MEGRCDEIRNREEYRRRACSGEGTRLFTKKLQARNGVGGSTLAGLPTQPPVNPSSTQKEILGKRALTVSV